MKGSTSGRNGIVKEITDRIIAKKKNRPDQTSFQDVQHVKVMSTVRHFLEKKK